MTNPKFLILFYSGVFLLIQGCAPFHPNSATGSPSPTGIVCNSNKVSLAWDPGEVSPGVIDPTVTGYNVYYGTSSGNYLVPVSSTTTTVTLTGLGLGPYYFAVKSFNASGIESGFSNEVSTTLTTCPQSVKLSFNH